MRVLSIDLPWSSSKGNFGFAWIDLPSSTHIDTSFQPGGAAVAPQIFAALARLHGQFDLILVDQPIGGAGTKSAGYRDVERAFANSTFVANGNRSIQAPRFQPGAPHAVRGLGVAGAARRSLGATSTVVVESFPQLSIPPLVTFATQRGLAVSAVVKLAAHKQPGPSRARAALQLVNAFRSWTGITAIGPGNIGQDDAVDALLAILPIWEIFTPAGQGTGSPVWLHAYPPGGPRHPSSVSRSKRASARARWLSPLTLRRIGAPGIRSDGLVSLRLPGWPAPAGPQRTL